MGNYIMAAKTSDVPKNAKIRVVVAGKEISLINLDGNYFALDNLCTHEGAPLCEGTIEGDEIECPWHLGRFNIKTGEATELPAKDRINTYPVRVNGELIEIQVS